MLTVSEWGNTTIIHGMYVVTKVLHNIATKEVTGHYIVNAKVLWKLIFNSACKFWCINWGSPQSFEESVPRVPFSAFVLPCVKHIDIAGSRLVCRTSASIRLMSVVSSPSPIPTSLHFPGISAATKFMRSPSSGVEWSFTGCGTMKRE